MRGGRLSARGDAGHGIGFHRRTMHFENPEHFERFTAALRQAGLPE